MLLWGIAVMVVVLVLAVVVLNDGGGGSDDDDAEEDTGGIWDMNEWGDWRPSGGDSSDGDSCIWFGDDELDNNAYTDDNDANNNWYVMNQLLVMMIVDKTLSIVFDEKCDEWVLVLIDESLISFAGDRVVQQRNMINVIVMMGSFRCCGCSILFLSVLGWLISPWAHFPVQK